MLLLLKLVLDRFW